MKSKMARLVEQVEFHKQEIDVLKEELKAVKEERLRGGAASFSGGASPIQSSVPASVASSSGVSAIPRPLLSPRSSEDLMCVHEGQGTFVVNVAHNSLDGHDLVMDRWTSHLGGTLFSEGGTDIWDGLRKHLDTYGKFYRVRGSTTQASRNFVLECKNCGAAVRGEYGSWDDPEVHAEARQTLGLFCLGRISQGPGAV